HGLAAFDEGGDPQAGKHAGDARAGGDGHDRDFVGLDGLDFHPLVSGGADIIHLGHEVFNGDIGDDPQIHAGVNRQVAVLGRDVDVHAVHAFAFTHLNGNPHLFQASIKGLEVEGGVGAKIDHDF